MAHEYIAAWGYRTGASHTQGTLRNSLAFDLTHVDLRDRVVLGASLYLHGSDGDCAVSTVRLSDPSGKHLYGTLEASTGSEAVRGSLTPTALEELQESCGSFFQVHVTLEDAIGKSLHLSGEASRQVLVLAVTAAAVAAVAA